MHVVTNITLIHYICNIIYDFLIGAPLLSLASPFSCVVRFTPIVRFTSVPTASATEEETTVSNSGGGHS